MMRCILLLLSLLLLTSPFAQSGVLAEDVPGETAAVFSELRSGSTGEAVRRLQERLTELGYDCGVPDGSFGQGTRSAVIAFQRHNGLDADGIAGEKTLRLLFSDAAQAAPAPPEPTDVLSEAWPILINKTHPAGEDLLPADLVLLSDLCDASLVKIKYSGTKAVRKATEALVTMLEDARDAGLRKWQISAAYRSYQDQLSLLNHKIQSYLKKNPSWSQSRARSAALRTVAEPGTSEHHLGLCFDINVSGASSFAGTKQCKWLHAHCWDYGFIVRYPKGKEEITGFTAEAWHIRYVGTEHSLRMRDENLCLEEYLDRYASEANREIIEYVDLDETPAL